jgi:acetolactate synthase-1/2/3 large subunit
MQQLAIDTIRPARAVVPPENAAVALLQTMAHHGVRVAFGIPGGLIIPVYAALAEVPEIKLVSTRHESMAAFAAMGHYVATGEPALVLTTSGPGATNAITGISAAFSEEIPLIAVSGEVATTSMTCGSFQDASTNAIDIVSMMRSVTRWSFRVDGSRGASGAAQQALCVARGPRPGPVFLSLPLDVAASPAMRSDLAEGPIASTGVNADACSKIARSLARAKRPLFIVGNGARDAAVELRVVARKLNVPVMTTAHAKGVFPESDPLSLGVMGWGGHASALAYLAATPDVVCIVGSRLGELSTNGWTLPIAGSESTYQIDRSPQLIGRNYPVTMGVIADARQALLAMAEAVPVVEVVHSATPSRRPGPAAVGVERADDHKVHPKDLFDNLQSAFPDASWAVDIGEHGLLAAHYLRIDDANRFRIMLGLGSMGSGIGVAMGWKHADASRPVICVCGDGGFMMHAGELLTCVERKINLIFVVANDGRWNMVNHGFDFVYGKVPDGLPDRVADIAGVAESLGAVGIRIGSLRDLKGLKLQELAGVGRPVVLDVRVDPAVAMSKSQRAASVQSVVLGAER